MDLSIVVACTDAEASIAECLRRLTRACTGLAAEIIVVDASADDTAAQAAAFGDTVRLLRRTPGTLTPELWAEGYRNAAGGVIAFTTGHCLVSPDWATDLVKALAGGAAGAGGPLVLAAGARPLDAAIYHLRYSAFTPRTLGAGRIAGEIAGDNAAYRRDWLDRYGASFAHGFWEIDFHHLVRRDGGWLTAAPTAVAEFGRSFPAQTILWHRFAHGAHFGAGRVSVGARTVARIVLAAPLVPLVLTMRTAGRVVHDGHSAARFLTAIPWFLLLATAWAAGEAWGALRGKPLPSTLTQVERRGREDDTRTCVG